MKSEEIMADIFCVRVLRCLVTLTSKIKVTTPRKHHNARPKTRHNADGWKCRFPRRLVFWWVTALVGDCPGFV